MGVRVVLPLHLRRLVQVQGELEVAVEPPATLGALMDALEARYPALSGAIREHGSGRRRPLVRFFACRRDITPDGWAVELPRSVRDGSEPLLVVGAIAGG